MRIRPPLEEAETLHGVEGVIVPRPDIEARLAETAGGLPRPTTFYR